MPSSRTPEGRENTCPICGHGVVIEPSTPPGDAPCPHCGALLWFSPSSGLSSVAAFSAQLGLECFEFADAVTRTKEQAIEEIVDRLVTHQRLPAAQRDEILQGLFKRESLGSTGIGRGVAVPHTRSAEVDRVVGAFAHFTTPVDFESLDGNPVNKVWLVVSPVERPGDHLRLLEEISRFLRG